MQQVNMHEAKTNLSRLVDRATKGEAFIIAKAGKPAVTVSACAPSSNPTARVGFLKGTFSVPNDFDTMGREYIADMFEAPE